MDLEIMSSELYPKSPKDIDVTKIKWHFWQKSFGYSFGNEYICLFDCEIQAIDTDGSPIHTLGYINNITHKAFGTFYLFKVFKMSNGQYGTDKSRPLKSINISSDSQGQSLDEFKQLGIFECINQYYKSNN